MKYTLAAQSLVGRVRRNNEDNWILNGEILPLTHKDTPLIRNIFSDEKARLVGVFDGMGGYSRGETASYIAASVAKKDTDGRVPSQRERLRELCMEANDEVCKEADGSSMGTTCALLSLYDGKYTVCNVGDSPVFLVRNGIITQISVDHNQRATFEKITGKKAPANQKFKLTQCIGIPKDEMLIEPYIASDSVRNGDIFLLCSDGLTDMVSLEDIQRILCEQKNPESAVPELVASAMEAGGRDNITVVCVMADNVNSRVKKPDEMLMRFFA